MKRAFVWDEWVHLQLTASVLPLTCSSAAPFSLFCSWLLFTIAHLPLQMVSLLFSNLIQILICHRKKKKRPEERRLTVNTTLMLPEQKLCLHENQIRKGIKHGDFETRLSLIPWEAQKSGSHCQLSVSVFQPYFQHRLELYATTLGSYSAFPGMGSIWECMTELKILQSWGGEYYYNVEQPWMCSSFFLRTAPNLLTICPSCSQQSSARPQVFPQEIHRVL